MTCKTMRLLNIGSFDYKSLVTEYESDISGWNLKFDEEEYLEIIFKTPSEMKYFYLQIRHKIDLSLLILSNQQIPFEIYSLFSPNLTSDEISLVRRHCKSLLAIRKLKKRDTYHQESYMIDFDDEKDAMILQSVLAKLRPTNFEYIVRYCEPITWALPFLAERALIVTGVRPELICKVIGMTSMSRGDDFVAIYGHGIDAYGEKLRGELGSLGKLEIFITQNAITYQRHAEFVRENEPFLHRYDRFSACKQNVYDINLELL